MFNTTKIINSKFFKFFPKFICDRLLSNIVYFEITNKKKLPTNNYIINSTKETNFSCKFSMIKKKIELENFTFPQLPGLIKTLMKENSTINFLDYGAGDIKNFLYLNKNVKKINYFYKDQKKLEELYKKKLINKKFKNFKFYKEKNKSKINFIYFGSSLQYINNLEQTIDSVITKKIKYILISGIIIFEKYNKDKIICIQKNIPKKIFFLYFYKKKYLINFFKRKKFKLIFSLKNNSDKYINFKNFNKGRFEYCDLLFKNER